MRSSRLRADRVWAGTRSVLLGMWIAAAGALAACAQAESSPTAPSPSSTLAAPVLPSGPSILITLTGRVTETVPTEIVEVRNALVQIVDGADAGKSARANDLGYYTIGSVRPGRFTVTASADGFVSASQAVDLGAQTTVDFHLARSFAILTFTIPGDLKSTDGTCSDGVVDRPCRIVAFPVHNPGPIDAALDWTPLDVDLDLALFKTGTTIPIVRSNHTGSVREQVRAQVSGSSVYELHITYAGGTAPVTYSVALSYPN